MKDTHHKAEAEILRQKAEEFRKKKSPTTVSHLSESETLKLIYELEVIQIERKMQNEALELHHVELKIQNEQLLYAREKAETEAQKYI